MVDSRKNGDTDRTEQQDDANNPEKSSHKPHSERHLKQNPQPALKRTTKPSLI